jgi:hypothetical protein
MRKLLTTLFAVLQAHAMPALEMMLLFIIAACDEATVPEVPEPSQRVTAQARPMSNAQESPLSAQEDSVRNAYEETGLPVCYITVTDSADITSRTTYVMASMRIEEAGRIVFEDTLLNIRGRGHASWTDSPKHPYRLKLSHKAELLGMAANKHFALLSNYVDKSLMRAAIGFRIGELLECDWTPQSRFVELVLNGKHQGCYQLTEAVKEGKDRIRIDKTGFIAEYIYPDRVAEEQVYFQTIDSGHFFKFKYPDEKDMTDKRLSYAANELDQFERALNRPSKAHEYAERIDVVSWAKWYYQQQLMMLEEFNLFVVKYDDTSDSRLALGPLWDFDWSLGSGYYDGEERPNPNHHLVATQYFRRLSADSLFMSEVIRLHRQYGKKVREGVLKYYDELSDLLWKSQALNFERWPILNERISIGAWPLGSWEKEVACDRQFFIDHYNYLDLLFASSLEGTSE